MPRPYKTGLGRHRLSAFLVTLAALILDPSVLNAGSITFTWHEDDATALVGDFTVAGSSQAAGEISTISTSTMDFMGYPITAGDFNAATAFPLYISTIDAAPDMSQQTIADFALQGTPLVIKIAFDTDWNTTGGEAWTLYNNGSEVNQGVGHWTISGANAGAVPEPSSLILAGFGFAGALLYRRGRKHEHTKLPRVPATD